MKKAFDVVWARERGVASPGHAGWRRYPIAIDPPQVVVLKLISVGDNVRVQSVAIAMHGGCFGSLDREHKPRGGTGALLRSAPKEG